MIPAPMTLEPQLQHERMARAQTALRRGEMQSVRFKATEPGVIRFRSIGRGPTMQGQVLVLPNP